jgi:hypothetical protein
MEEALLDAAQTLLRCGAAVERGLAAVLTKSDALGHQVTYVLSDVLSKLARDVTGLPVLLGGFTSDARVMRCLVVVLHEVLLRVQPEKLTSPEQVAEAEVAVRKLCARHDLPTICADHFVLLVDEISRVFQGIEALLRTAVVKDRNVEILRRCLRHFFRDARAPLISYSFNSLRLSVCLRSMAEGKTRVSRKTKEELFATLQLVKAQARCLAAVDDLHADNIFTAVALARRRQTTPAVQQPGDDDDDDDAAAA